MKRWKTLLLILLAIAILASIYGVVLIRRGFSTTEEPSTLEKVVARAVRNLSIPSTARIETNPWKATPEILHEARDHFLDRCAVCHGNDGSGQTQVGRNLYPKPPDLRSPETQSLTDGQIHYIIKNGVRLTGMPAWGNPHDEADSDGWKLVLFIRDLRPLSPAEESQQQTTVLAAHYTGSPACAKCHQQIYDAWKKTPMANVVRDPREHPDATIPDLSTDPLAKFTKDQVALVYGSLWKQRYFTKIGDDYFPEPAQWDVIHRVWRPYFVAKGTDWWEPFYPPDNMRRPTGPTCDGCHSVDYNIHTKQVVEWNVGCERCHGPGSEHAAHPSRGNILNPARLDYVQASDTCIQCHSQGRPPSNPIEGKYYDWPVGYRVGQNLRDFWQLEEHTLGQASFTHFPDGTAHKNRMQGNDFVQSVMYRRGITCFTCHDVHGTANYAELRKPADKLCLDCHGPLSLNGPRTATLEEHTHHKAGSAGSQCIACHMPKIETTIADVKVRAHTFAFISPAMSDKYQIPNPCMSCHADKSTAWANEALRPTNRASFARESSMAVGHHAAGFKSIGAVGASRSCGDQYGAWFAATAFLSWPGSWKAMAVSRQPLAISIRRATPADVPAILDCLRAAFENYRQFYTPGAFIDTVLTPETLIERLRKMAVFEAINHSGEVVGTVACSVVNGGEGHIRGMAVLPAYHGAGIAGKLLTRVESELRELKCTRATLDTTEPLQRAMRFYEKYGFRRSGRITDFFGMPLIEYHKLL